MNSMDVDYYIDIKFIRWMDGLQSMLSKGNFILLEMKDQSLKLPVITEERENFECLRLNNYLPENLIFPLTYNEINSQFMIPLAEKFEHTISYFPFEKNLRIIITGRPNSKIFIYREGS
jgi:hypothetical protein